MSDVICDFIARWASSGGSEQANAQMFLAEFCDALELPRPEPAQPVNEENSYSFERKIRLNRGDGSFELKRLDLYRKGCFVLEAKQGKATPTALQLPGITTSSAAKRGSRQWEDTMQRAKNQAEHYIRALPPQEGRPPFIITADIGYCFDIYSEFSCTGGVYLPYPDMGRRRILVKDLVKPEVQNLFRALWLDPFSLDPSRHAARVTEEVARHLAELARLLEADGHGPERVSQFLMRCIFTMFAEDVSLIPGNSFTDMLQRAMENPDLFTHTLKDLWTAMNGGTVSVALGRKLLRFNGNIFADPEVLPLGAAHIGILLEASHADWKDVEPAIFGTLLERALNPKERHKLGAHYTPRAYVERLVLPTVMQPLRAEWVDVQTAANLLAEQGKILEARKAINNFSKRLRAIQVLDPACGSGNFLYVTLEHMKRLEAEVVETSRRYGEQNISLQEVDPNQFLGLEVNPRAAHIAEMVLWIGYLQWHFRAHGHTPPPDPIIKKYGNIRQTDALLTWKKWSYATDKDGKALSRWDGETYKIDPATGREVPDESATTVDKVYEGVAVAEWPKADFIVGNPPFIGNKRMRAMLGSGYVEALRKTYSDLPESCDFVMYWWHKAALLTQQEKITRFGFITTNSITQVFNRRVLAPFLKGKQPLHLVYAIPDHPWVDASDGAAVRIAMTVAAYGVSEGELNRVIAEKESAGHERDVELAAYKGFIHADLSIGADVLSAMALLANADMACRGVIPVGQGFIVNSDEAYRLGLGRISGLERHIRPFLNGRDITDKARGVLAIDLLGLSVEDVRALYPEVYQWLLERVKPEREQVRRKGHREQWWIFGEPRKTLRPALRGLYRYIVTGQVSKHRFFVFVDSNIIADDKLIVFPDSDAYLLGVLSSRMHTVWALASGGKLGVGNDPVYNKTSCFDPFPFPEATPEQQACIRDLGERLDAHRKARQALFPELTMTGMYNVLEALRQGREQSAKGKTIHERGLVTVLRELHDELDAAVAEAYGWPADLPDEDILSRLAALNAKRVNEERQGKVRWLRPEYQTRSKEERKQVQAALDIALPVPAKDKKAKTAQAAQAKMPWPSSPVEQSQAVRSVIERLAASGSVPTVESIVTAFSRAKKERVGEILSALTTLGFVEA